MENPLKDYKDAERVIGMSRSLWHEFKEFAVKGNMIDLAVGVVIGGAFGTIVKSLVDDVIMPPLGYLTGGVDFKNKMWELKAAVPNPADPTKNLHDAVDLRWGMFLNNVITFLIVAWSMFIVIKFINMLHHKEPPPEAASPTLTTDQELLTEIRDLLKGEKR
jgi:large conductance mechanosensitive channel